MRTRFLKTVWIAILGLTSFSTIANAEVEISAPNVKVERVGTHLYYRSSWSQLSEDEQRMIIDRSVELLKNELSEDVVQVSGLKTLSNQMLSEKALNDITAAAEKSVQIADTHSFRGLLPSAILLYGGVNGGFGLGANGGISGDLGEVIFPQKVIDVDTETGVTRAYIKIDHRMVLVPHAHFGLGAGGGVSYSFGAAWIFGDMTSAADFHGVAISGSADMKLVFGVDAQVSAVHNLGSSQTFFVVGGEVDVGLEAKASLDGEGGYVYSMDEYANLFGKKMKTGGTVEVPVPNPQK